MAIKKIKLNDTSKNPMIQPMVLMFWIAKENKTESREHKMNTTTSVLGTMPTGAAATAAPRSSSKTLANLLLTAGVAALVVGVDQMIDSWAESHVVAAWLALRRFTSSLILTGNMYSIGLGQTPTKGTV